MSFDNRITVISSNVGFEIYDHRQEKFIVYEIRKTDIVNCISIAQNKPYLITGSQENHTNIYKTSTGEII